LRVPGIDVRVESKIQMIRFDEHVAERTRRAMQYTKEHEAELEPRTITIDLRKEDNFLSAASRPGSDHKWYADESKERGGTGKGPSPLSYFLSSIGFCQFVHYAEHAMVDGIRLESLEMKVNGTIVAQRPRRFTEVTYEVKIFSPEREETIKQLARKAADDCYVTNTLKTSCKVTGTIIHNDKKIDSHSNSDFFQK
jgi:uncharacterized OsmC-like protein